MQVAPAWSWAPQTAGNGVRAGKGRTMRNDRFAFATQRFCHAREELLTRNASDRERLLGALIALAPLSDDQIPATVETLYRTVQDAVGTRLWQPGRSPGELADRIDAMDTTTRRRCIGLLVEASAAMRQVERQRHTRFGRRLAGRARFVVPARADRR